MSDRRQSSEMDESTWESAAELVGDGRKRVLVLGCSPLPFEKPVGDLAGAYSRRINIQHRLVYQVLDDVRTVKVLRMWTHYD